MISGTAGRIALKFGVWLDTITKLLTQVRDGVHHVRTCALVVPVSEKNMVRPMSEKLGSSLSINFPRERCLKIIRTLTAGIM